MDHIQQRRPSASYLSGEQRQRHGPPARSPLSSRLCHPNRPTGSCRPGQHIEITAISTEVDWIMIGRLAAVLGPPVGSPVGPRRVPRESGGGAIEGRITARDKWPPAAGRDRACGDGLSLMVHTCPRGRSL